MYAPSSSRRPVPLRHGASAVTNQMPSQSTTSQLRTPFVRAQFSLTLGEMLHHVLFRTIVFVKRTE